jgi:hypothetical protein
MFVLLACLSSSFGQSLSGTWCNTANAQDCVTIRQSGESLQATFAVSGRSTGEGVGWTRGNAISVAFRRLDNNDIATWTAELDNAGRLAGRTANPNGAIRWTGAYAREAVTGNIDPTGSWQHVPGASWVITALGNNRYQAQEKGLGEAAGPAYFTSSGTFKIDYTTRDGAIKGYYEIRFAADNRTATGTVRELTGPQRAGTSNWTRIGGATTSTTPPVITGNIDPTGTWQHVPGASWVITALGNNRYQAQEKGLGEAAGPAYFTSSGTFKIDYVTRDGAIRGYYEMRFANDNRTATGTVRELTGPQRTGASKWTRIGGATTTTNNNGSEPWLPGSFDWVAGQFLVVHPQHRVTVYLNGSKINEGPWEYLGANRFRFTMEKGGYVDTVELSPDGKTLTGRNNQGNELRGTRRVTSPRP